MTEDEEDEPDVEDQEEQTPETEENSQSEEDEEVEVTHSEGNEGLQDKLNDLSASQVLLAGGLAGLLVGLLAGYALSPSGIAGQPQEASQSVKQLIDSGRFNGTVDVGQPMNQHGMYYFNVTMTQETVNGTQTSYQPAYVTKDAELLFPVVQNFMMQSPINIQQALARQQQAPGNGTAR
jgi:hypothetical protein